MPRKAATRKDDDDGSVLVDANEVAGWLSEATGDTITAAVVRQWVNRYRENPDWPQPPQPVTRVPRGPHADPGASHRGGPGDPDWLTPQWEPSSKPDWLAWYALTRHRPGNPGFTAGHDIRTRAWHELTPQRQAIITTLIGEADAAGRRVTPQQAAKATGLAEATAAQVLHDAGVPMTTSEEILPVLRSMIAAASKGSRVTVAKTAATFGISTAWARELLQAAGKGRLDDEAALAIVREMVKAGGPTVTAGKVASTAGVTPARAKRLLALVAGPKPGPDLSKLVPDEDGWVFVKMVTAAYGYSPSAISQQIARGKWKQVGQDGSNLLLKLEEVRARLG